jgi:predicted transcriptional regulator
MSTKELAINTIRDLPESATWEDIEERIRFLAAIERGRKDIREGKVVPHEEVKKQLAEWLSG